jgi:hypothetical protein
MNGEAHEPVARRRASDYGWLWTPDLLAAHLEQINEAEARRTDDRFAAQNRATEAALASAEKAVMKAEALANARYISEQEARSLIEKNMVRLMPRGEYEIAHGILADRFTAIETRQNAVEAKGVGRGQLMVWLFLGIASAVSIIGIALDLLMRH